MLSNICQKYMWALSTYCHASEVSQICATMYCQIVVIILPLWQEHENKLVLNTSISDWWKFATTLSHSLSELSSTTLSPWQLILHAGLLCTMWHDMSHSGIIENAQWRYLVKSHDNILLHPRVVQYQYFGGGGHKGFLAGYVFDPESGVS